MIMLRSLKLYGMSNAVEDLVARGGPAFDAATPMLSQLLKAEIAEREVRSITYQTKVARFPSYKDLAGFDLKSSDINEATVKQLHRCGFMENAENVVLIGGPGTGKSHVATAIGVQAIEHHRCKVRFYSTVEPVNALEQEKALGKTGKMAAMMKIFRCGPLRKFSVLVLTLARVDKSLREEAAGSGQDLWGKREAAGGWF